jgi:hypothetical protein
MTALKEQGKETFATININDCIVWLEKQSEPLDKEKVLIGARKDVALSIIDFLDRNTLGMFLSNIECKDLEDAVVNSDWSKVYDYMKKKLEKQSKQKPIDKGELKFGPGDWVACEELNTAKIISINGDRYEVEFIDGTKGFPHIDYIDRNFHLWTIQDARDGDILCDRTTIFIFKDLLSDGSVMSYCDYDTDSGESDAFCPLSVNLLCSKIIPATKEQRDFLFSKMKEAGYKWDSEKKELKKIEQNPAERHREDEQNLNACLGYIPDEFLRRWLTNIIHVKYDRNY